MPAFEPALPSAALPLADLPLPESSPDDGIEAVEPDELEGIEELPPACEGMEPVDEDGVEGIDESPLPEVAGEPPLDELGELGVDGVPPLAEFVLQPLASTAPPMAMANNAGRSA